LREWAKRIEGERRIAEACKPGKPSGGDSFKVW
jgi:hypothetical protein